MRDLIKFVGLLSVSILIFAACENSDHAANSNSVDQFGETISSIADFPAKDVSPEEEAGLSFMREEEKLARDVYTVLYAKWNLRVFNNISRSEQMHTDAIKALLEKYDLSDPVVNDDLGVFQNQDLQNLYDGLVASGDSSLINALYVATAIEEIDILDLQKELENVVDNQDITFVYENLMRGSRNHLRAFVKNLSSNGIEYAPRYLSEEAYLEIISSDHEHGK
jgi:hypothetical protein